MTFGWLKNAMPRGLYGRAALILILPVIFLQLLVSVIFVQRHFDGVTRSMTSAMSIELRFLQDQLRAAPGADGLSAVLEEIAPGLELTVTTPPTPMPPDDVKKLQDLTGNTVIATLRDRVDGVARISLADRRVVQVWLETRPRPTAKAVWLIITRPARLKSARRAWRSLICATGLNARPSRGR